MHWAGIWKRLGLARNTCSRDMNIMSIMLAYYVEMSVTLENVINISCA